ncbi:hypothetical protein KAX97_13975 [candidate division WOR-3 bacterium]|nr:hypothetical protein [candidate division WOR-3 bacterium]
MVRTLIKIVSVFGVLSILLLIQGYAQFPKIPKKKKQVEYITEIDFNLQELKDVTDLPEGEDTYQLDEHKLLLPPKSKVTFTFKSYCLAPCKAGPGADDAYVFSHESPDIPLADKIIKYYGKHPEIDQPLKQHLIWNLVNRVKFEDLSTEEKALLTKIDRLACLKVNNYFKEKKKGILKKLVEDRIPEEIRSKIFITKEKFYTYEDYQRQIEALTSEHPSPAKLVPQPVCDTKCYGLVKMDGYSKATIEFYNPTKEVQKIEFNPLYIWRKLLSPNFPGIQPIFVEIPSTVTGVRG